MLQDKVLLLSEVLLTAKQNQFVLFGFVCGLLVLDVVLPIPSSIVCVASVATMGATLGGVAIFFGLTSGSFLGYYLGRQLEPISGARGSIIFGSGMNSLRNFVLLLVTRPIPVLAEVSLVEAGLSNLPRKSFVAAAIVSSACVAVAYSQAAKFALSRNKADFVAFSMILLATVLISTWLVIAKTKANSSGRKEYDQT